jgi:anti-sigma B factor antagonist
MDTAIRLTVQDRGPIRVITMQEPRIDAAIAICFRETVRQAATGADRVVLDLSSVSFLDSSGLGALVGILKLLGADTRLELAGLQLPVARVMQLTRMDRVFTIHPEVPDAGPGDGTGVIPRHADAR